MAGKLLSSATGLLKFLPMVAIVAAAYKYYSDRGMDGIIADLQAITFEGVKAKATQFGTGFALILGAPFVVRYIPNSTLKPIVAAAMYYMGATQIFGALKSGAGMGHGGAGRGWVPAMNYAGNPYLGGRKGV